jgi:site-specific recombinase XerD
MTYLEHPSPTSAVLPIFQAIAQLPALFRHTPASAKRTLEFFTAQIRNPNTRKAYAHSVSEFAAWCALHGLHDLAGIEPVHVAAYIEQLQGWLSAPWVKQHLATLQVLFDWLVVGQVIPVNPASSVKGPRYSVPMGKTPVLAADEARAMLDAIDLTTAIGLRDRAMIALLVHICARVGATLQMRVEDVYTQGRLPGFRAAVFAASLAASIGPRSFRTSSRPTGVSSL